MKHTTAAVAALATVVLYFGCRKIAVKVVSWLNKVTSKKKRGLAYLKGAFAPVHDELFQEQLPVDGALPDSLNGLYLRNGPNPFFEPLSSYHWFDGDGMLHAVRIRNGQVSYCNRFMDTFKLQQERAIGGPVFMKLGDLEGKRGLMIVLMEALLTATRVIRKQREGTATANTAVVYAAKKILATSEGDLPYQVRMACSGLIESAQRLALGKWDRAFTAHPKLDPETGVLHFFGYGVMRKPRVVYGRMTPEGHVDKMVPINIPEPVMMHDFAITRHYAILMDVPLVFNLESMIKNGTLLVTFRTDRPARFGLMPLDAASEAAIHWFELPPCVIFHTANAWETPEGQVKLFVCRIAAMDFSQDGGPLKEEEWSLLHEITLDPASGAATIRKLSSIPCDFPVVNPSCLGRPSQFSWIAISATEHLTPGEFLGIAKMKLDSPEGSDACVGRIDYEPGWVSSEAMFVPRYEDTAQCNGEDDGFMLAYITHTTDPVPSKLVVYDARTMDSRPLATVTLPARVPLGFHGLFINETKLQASLAAQ